MNEIEAAMEAAKNHEPSRVIIDRHNRIVILDHVPGITSPLSAIRLRAFAAESSFVETIIEIEDVMAIHEMCTKVMAQHAARALGAEAPSSGFITAAMPLIGSGG